MNAESGPEMDYIDCIQLGIILPILIGPNDVRRTLPNDDPVISRWVVSRHWIPSLPQSIDRCGWASLGQGGKLMNVWQLHSLTVKWNQDFGWFWMILVHPVFFPQICVLPSRLRHPQIFSPKGCSSCHQRNSIRAWSPLKKRRIAERASSIDASADPKLDKRERIELETLPDDNMILIWYNMPPKIVHILLFVFSVHQRRINTLLKRWCRWCLKKEISRILI